MTKETIDAWNIPNNKQVDRIKASDWSVKEYRIGRWIDSLIVDTKYGPSTVYLFNECDDLLQETGDSFALWESKSLKDEMTRIVVGDFAKITCINIIPKEGKNDFVEFSVQRGRKL